MTQINELTLSQSITPLTEEEVLKYTEEFSLLVCEMVNELYQTYNVLRQDPINKLDGHLMVFQSRLGDSLTGSIHDKMFKLAFDKRINIFEANKEFKKLMNNGAGIPLGEAVIVDTAMSNILSSNEFNVSITYMLKEDYEEKKRIEEEVEKELSE